MRDKNAVDHETEMDSEKTSGERFEEARKAAFGDSPFPPRPDPAKKRGKSTDDELKERFPDATPLQREMYKEMRAMREANEALAKALTDQASSAFTL